MQEAVYCEYSNTVNSEFDFIFMKRAFLLLSLVLLMAGMGIAQNVNPGNSADEFLSVQPEVTKVYIPNAFTPNGDGVNDEYFIPDANLQQFTFSVFDRWGNKVYDTNSSNFRWNGESGGSQTPEGTYVYLLNATDYRGNSIKRSGALTIVR